MATQLQPTNDQEQPRALVPMSAQRESYSIMKDQARLFSISKLLPDAVRGNSPDEAMANCLIALQMAQAMDELPFMVMQNIHIVKGKAGFAAQFMIARANSSGVFSGRINWEVDKSDKENLSVTAYAKLAETGERVEFTADMAMARAEGWTSNAKYKSMPELMLRYRSATFLVRLYAPDVMLGYRTADELEDMGAALAPAQPTLTSDMLIEQAKPTTPHDPVTGEVIEATAEPEPEAETPAEDEPAEVEADTNVNDRAEPEPTLEEDYGTAPAGQQTLLDEVTANPQQPGDDPAAAKANEIIGELTAASSIAEITAVWGRNAGHLQAMEGTALHAQLVQTKELRLAEIKAAPVA